MVRPGRQNLGQILSLWPTVGVDNNINTSLSLFPKVTPQYDASGIETLLLFP